MCGICGIISNKKITEHEEGLIKKMNTGLFHRGPDSEGTFKNERIEASMRRLSIIDVGGGSQPLYNEDRSISIVINGEIYNYIELRKELKTKGRIFFTKSDCETVIHAYEEYGEFFLEHLRGMFAFCLYDSKKEIVVLARDRLGEKPLYIRRENDNLFFSSELKSLLEVIPKEKRKLNKKSLFTYFYYGYLPEPNCFIEEVEKIAPGKAIFFDLKKNKEKIREYWTIDNIETLNKKPIATIRNELEKIEEIIVRSDVPVGISLSGGIDSSLIASLASKYRKDGLHAFSVGYPGYPENDERRVAEELAKELNLVFHNIEISSKDFIKDFDDLIGSMDQPIADIAAYGYYSVSKKAREKGVLVLLTGFGGDELFWGYDWVQKSFIQNSLRKKFRGRLLVFANLIINNYRKILRSPIEMLRGFWRDSFSSKLLFYQMTPIWLYMRQNHKKIFEKTFEENFNENNILTKDWPEVTGDIETETCKLLTNIWLTSNCLDLGDQMSMRHSIEMRLPLVDYKLYETVVGLRKFKNDFDLGYKGWLIEATKDILNEKIYKRHKRGFTPPSKIWIKEILKKEKNLLENGYLTKNKIIKREFIKEAYNNIDRNQKFLYTALVFEKWAKIYLQ